MAGKDKFNDSYITNTGRHMIVSIGGGVGKITYTKAIAYGQDISGIDEQDIYALSSLTDERLETQVTVSDIEDSSITVTADFNNKTLEDDVSFNSIGWFAKLDTDDTKHNLKANQEYLLAITPANGLQTLAAASPDHRSSQSICVNLTMGISNAANVDMTVNEAGVIHQGELDIQLTKVKKSFDEKLSTKANTNDVYTKADVDGKTSGTVVTGYDIATKIPVKENTAYSSKRLVDNQVADVFADAINQLAGRRTVDAPDFNSLTDSGSYYVTNPSEGKNAPEGSWGNLLVSNGNGIRISQLYFPDSNANPYFRTWRDNNDWQPWVQLANTNQVNDAKNTATQANTNADSRLPLAGGSMNTNAQISFNDGTMGKLGGLTWNGSTDSAKIYGDVTANDNLDLAFDLGDDGSNHFSFRRNGSETSAITSDGHYTGTVDWGHVNGRPQEQINRINVDGPLFKHLTRFTNWGDLFDGYSVNGFAATNGSRLVAFRNDTDSPNFVGGNSSGIGFGGGDTKGYLNVSYDQHQAIIGGGNGNAPLWHEEVAWKSDIDRLQSIINQQNQTIQSLTTRLTNAENEINYIKANYVEGRRFPASQEAQANSWENENPQRIAFIER